jgi:hypothetical protein
MEAHSVAIHHGNTMSIMARQKGLSLDAYVLQSVLQNETWNGTALSDEAKRRAREEAGRSIRELRKGASGGGGCRILSSGTAK